MSTVRKDYGALQEIYVGTTKAFVVTVIDPETGMPKDLRNAAIYHTARFRILNASFREVGGIIDVKFTDRETGMIQYTVPTSITVPENAGNHIGNIEFLNIDNQIIDQQLVNFNILEN